MRVLWLAEALSDAGLHVVQHNGWRTRGSDAWSPRAGIVHATAAPRTQPDSTQVAIVRDGHSTLAGPIANACVDRSGRWHVLASGRCNTVKIGWAGPASGLGNSHILGVEACNDNRGEAWPAAQYDSYVRGWAVICQRMGWKPDAQVIGHKEHQPGDKSDPSFNMDTFRRRVAAVMEEGDMPSERDIWFYRLKPEAAVAREYPGIREDGYTARAWMQYAYRWARRVAGRVPAKIKPNAWMVDRWDIPADGYSPATYWRSGYGHARRAGDAAEQALEGQAAIRAELSAVRELLRQLLERAGSPVDMAAVEAAALAGAQQAMAQLDIRVQVSPTEEPTGDDGGEDGEDA